MKSKCLNGIVIACDIIMSKWWVLPGHGPLSLKRMGFSLFKKRFRLVKTFIPKVNSLWRPPLLCLPVTLLVWLLSWQVFERGAEGLSDYPEKRCFPNYKEDWLVRAERKWIQSAEPWWQPSKEPKPELHLILCTVTSNRLSTEGPTPLRLLLLYLQNRLRSSGSI